MSFIKAFWPFSFQKKETVKALVITVIVHFVVSAVLGVILGLLSKIPLIGWIFGILRWLAGLYITAGIIFTFLNYFKVGPFQTE